MSKQVTVRLPDDLVEFIDLRVEEGEAPSRAAVIARAVERERRRATAERDVAILTGIPCADDLDDLAAYAARTPLDVE
jgi:Arc/MetJ-type ribon-helix-helix transcriptional regulator